MISDQKRLILPVIHVKTKEQAIYNLNIVKQSGADGAWLISHGFLDYNNLYNLYTEFKKEYDLWLGVNFLDLSANEVFNIFKNKLPDGVWSDNAGVLDNDDSLAIKIKKSKGESDCVYFGGVAFKYQQPVKDLYKVTQSAKEYMDYITTSGEGTGIEAKLEKIEIMADAAKDTPLAIASGITIENINLYLPFIKAFLVSTGISDNFDNLDLYKAQKLVDIIKSF